jgi:hypothetical protein
MRRSAHLKAKRFTRPVALALALSAGTFMTTAVPALAQMQQPPAQTDQAPPRNSDPLTGTLPEAWDSAWDSGTYDRLHYVIGTVASFSPYRLLTARGSGETTQVDLKHDTIIRPMGLTLSPGEHVAVVGYWSKGTFIANRIVLRGA